MFRFFLTLSCLFTFQAQAASTADYSKKWNAAYWQARNAVTNLAPGFSWVDGGIIYKLETDDRKWKFIRVDVADGKKRDAFDRAVFASELTQLLGRAVDADRLPLEDVRVSDGVLNFRVGKTHFRQVEGQLENFKPEKKRKKKAKKTDSNTSPDGKWRAQIKDGKVFLNNLSGNQQEKQIGTPNKKGSYYVGKIDWNSTSTHFIAHHVEPGQRRTVTMVESSPKDQLQPKQHVIRYDKPGDRIDRYEPHVFSIDGKAKHRPDPVLTKNSFTTNQAQWSLDGKTMRYEYVERGYGKHYLISMDAAKGTQRILAKEESDTFIFVGGVRYRLDLPSNNEIIWGSERDGWRHLYLLDAETGEVKNRITQGEWIVRKVVKVDTKTRSIIFTASGKNQGEDPYHIHWYRVNFDGSQLTSLTQGDGSHHLGFSPDGKYYMDMWSRVDHPTVYELRRSSDGKLVTTLAKSMVKKEVRIPERFVCKDRNGKFDIWGMILTPPNFDPNKKYPVIENIYAGPHGAFVPKKFQPAFGHMTELAAEGFIVVKIDGLGTNYRHRNFSHFSYKNLVDAGLPDRIKWIKTAASTRSYIDITRVGIYGGSAGGQSSTGAVLHHGDFYKAAASDCGCHDNRMDKIWWNEQWMDWPVGPHYKQQSNATHAEKLKGALMLTVGELDKNVDPASTTQLVNALMKADKDFEYYIAPSGGHGSGEKAYLRRKRIEFFKKHLGGVK